MTAYWVLPLGIILKLERRGDKWFFRDLDGEWHPIIIKDREWGTKFYTNYWDAWARAQKMRRKMRKVKVIAYYRGWSPEKDQNCYDICKQYNGSIIYAEATIGIGPTMREIGCIVPSTKADKLIQALKKAGFSYCTSKF